MRWTPGRTSDNIEDRRGMGMRAGLPIGIGGLLLLGLLSLLTGRNFLSLLADVDTGPTTYEGPVQSSPEEDRRVQFVSFDLDDAQNTWRQILCGRYQDAKLVLFRDQVESACGFGQAASGPFYCPGDQKVYIDLSFYDELQRRFGAPGEFAQAYVLAHELGHHVQNLTGIEPQVRRAMQARPDMQNELSVRLELQADCLAGVWGHYAAQPGRAAKGQVELEAGDMEQGLNAAAAIGDDRLQRMTTGSVMPDRFTHGTSAQRVEWLKRGLTTGDPNACDTSGN